MPLPPPGTFRLYAFAEPPLPAGRYTLTGTVTGLPGPVEDVPAVVEVVAPRYAMPPDQILGTFPPAGARGAFTSRLPQVVLRRRTLPWERSPDLVPGGTPTPWLALVLIAEGEGRLLSDVPVEQCVTSGVALDPDRDVPKGACLEVPQRVVTAVFPTREDLALLTHVREVDILDTELAMGDDDGWMAVVLCNRLPQPNTRYLACLINLEGQYGELPDPAGVQLELDYDRFVSVVDLRALAATALGAGATVDQAVMGLPGTRTISGAAGPGGSDRAAPAASARGPSIRGASGASAPSGGGWTARNVPENLTHAGPAAEAAAGAKVNVAKLALADGFSFSPALLAERVLRFPALAYWSFMCEERGDFQYLAEHVSSRLLGHVPDPDVPETPDGDPAPPGGAPPPGARPEPVSPRPLPLVAETGHVLLPSVTRRGDATDSWFRGPLAPAPVERSPLRTDEETDETRPRLAHHADQLRLVVPDGHEDLGYAAAFEIGRLLALNQPGFAAALARWRQDAFGAARVRSATGDAIAEAPEHFRDRALRPDPLTDDTAERVRAAGAGRRTVRAAFALLGDKPDAVAPARPLADPGDAVRDLHRVVGQRRDKVLAAGLGIQRAVDGVEPTDAAAIASALAGAPAAVAGERDAELELKAVRQALEDEAGRIADSVERVERVERLTFGPGGRR